MSRVVDAWRVLTGTKASRTGAASAVGMVGRAVGTPRNYENLAREAYQKNVIAFRSVAEVARSVSSVPWTLFEEGANGTERELINHDILHLLERPNPMQGGTELFEAWTAYLLLSGNTYLEGVTSQLTREPPSAAHPPQELWVKRPDRMRIVVGPVGVPSAYEFRARGGGEGIRFPVDAVTGASAILHVRKFNPLNDYYGQADAEAAAFSVDTHNEIGRWNFSLLKNDGRIPGVLSTDEVLGDEEFARLTEQLEDSFMGSGNAGRPMIMEGGLKWQPTAVTPKQMDYLDSKHSSARDVANAFGVPSQLLGIPGDNTYSNFQEARLALWEQTVIPLLGRMGDALSNWFSTIYDQELRLRPDMDKIPALVHRRQAKIQTLESANFLTINEKRTEAGFEEHDDGDVILVPAGLLPLEAAIIDDDEAAARSATEPEDGGISPDDAIQQSKLAYGE